MKLKKREYCMVSGTTRKGWKGKLMNLLILLVLLSSVIPYLRTALDASTERELLQSLAVTSHQYHTKGFVPVRNQFELPPPPDDLLVQQSDRIYHRREWDAAPVVLEDYKLVFFTTAKVGCTVWKQLFRRMMGYGNWRTTNGKQMLPWDPDYNGLKYLYDYNRTTANHMLTNPSWTRAIVVRDPKERFLSAYLDKVVQNPFFTNKCCCPKHRNCVSPQTTFSEFFDLAQTCENAHWAPQSRRMEAKYFPYLNFVGRMETIAQDAKALLIRIGAWEDFGKSGWGAQGDEAIFQPHHEPIHATRAQDRLRSYYTPELEAKVDHYCYMDYQVPYLGLKRTTLFADNATATS